MAILQLRTNNERGQLLIEILVAVMIIILVLVGASALTSNSVKTVRETDQRAMAARIAQTQVNHIEKDISVAQMFSDLDANTSGSGVGYSCQIVGVSVFGCTMVATRVQGNANKANLTVTVSWSDQSYTLTKQYER